ncbi:alkaline phosphatase [Sphingomonas oleivorans]|uniref:Alkaline phosphatase n=1 Tax=Sphingomonas oleivorans TaxID=1735121 RepID=A0A2T5FZS4_9SPHN|nr:alkaline phosphatase D family protein [Sphingomonas oleivorans]PTQ12199.1 alkaline phosphatase [Sphingomonas oleivorans]
MISYDRRKIMAGLLGMGGAGLVAGPATLGSAFAAEREHPRNLKENPVFIQSPFQLGVASGDPSADGFVIWTRLAPEPLAPGGGMAMVPMLVRWEIASDERFATIVARGDAIAHPEFGHAVHVELSGLQPDRPYWYRFLCGSERSVPGRARTFPQPGAPKDRVRFAVAGCQQYEEGYYTAWRRIAEEPIDFLFHYGDYIYEGRDSGGGTRLLGDRPFVPLRRHVGQEIYSLDDYRRRYAQYKTDPDLQAAHAAAPWFISFDDHEIDNNWAADADQDGTPVEIFRFRRAIAMQAFYEHMPLRRRSLPVNGHMQIYRRAQYGDLLQAHFLDTRQYRSDQAQNDRDSIIDAEVLSPRRTMLGDAQEAWLFDGLDQSRARWNLIAQQVMVMALGRKTSAASSDLIYSMDQWSGYQHSRRRLLQHIHDRRLANVIIVSGDAHRHFAGDVVMEDQDKVIASEYLATSITSGSDGTGEGDAFDHSVRSGGNGFLKAMIDRRGYVLCDVDRETWRGDLKILDTVMERNGRLSTFASFISERNEPGLKRA